MDSLEQNLLRSAWSTHRKKRAIPLQSHPHCTPSGHRAGKDIHDQKETMCARNWTYSEPSGRVALHLPFLSACVKSPCSNSPPSESHLLSPITSQDPNFESSFPRISTKWRLGLATDWNLYKASTPCLSNFSLYELPSLAHTMSRVPHPCLCHSLSSLKAFSKSPPGAESALSLRSTVSSLPCVSLFKPSLFLGCLLYWSNSGSTH